jgi:hypothetical protein
MTPVDATFQRLQAAYYVLGQMEAARELADSNPRRWTVDWSATLARLQRALDTGMPETGSLLRRRQDAECPDLRDARVEAAFQWLVAEALTASHPTARVVLAQAARRLAAALDRPVPDDLPDDQCYYCALMNRPDVPAVQACEDCEAPICAAHRGTPLACYACARMP